MINKYPIRFTTTNILEIRDFVYHRGDYAYEIEPEEAVEIIVEMIQKNMAISFDLGLRLGRSENTDV